MSKGVTIAFVLLLGTGSGAVAACGGSGTNGSASAGTGASTTSSGHGGASTSTSSTPSTGTHAGAGGGVNLEGGVGDAMMDGDACGTVVLQQMITPGNIVVVFDQSDSMKDQFTEPDGGTGGPKYQVALDALVAAVTPNESLLNGGAIFFPSVAVDGGCAPVAPLTMSPQIQIEKGAAFVKDFKDHFNAPWTTILSTPTVDALNVANTGLNPAPAHGKTALVLMTDGEPTCDKNLQDLLTPVQALYGRGIKTYVVGLPGAGSAATLLNELAAAGGTNSYLSPADPATLQMELSTIASDTLDKCTITLSPPPADPSLVNLLVTDSMDPNGIDVPRGDGGNGWTISPDGTTVTLEGSVCQNALGGDYTSIQFVYGCPTVN